MSYKVAFDCLRAIGEAVEHNPRAFSEDEKKSVEDLLEKRLVDMKDAHELTQLVEERDKLLTPIFSKYKVFDICPEIAKLLYERTEELRLQSEKLVGLRGSEP